jgi:AAA domain, putative AbiEii toxin, Type IV TA system/AAA domain
MYIRSLSLENMRAFKKASVSLLYPGRKQNDGYEDCMNWPPRLPNVNVVLGTNGSGKSTILDAAALAVLTPVISQSGYVPQALVRRTKTGEIDQASANVSLLLHKQDVGRSAQPPASAVSVASRIERRGDLEMITAAEPAGAMFEQMFSDQSPAFFIVGYGALRRVEAQSASDLQARRKARHLRYDRVATLFEDHVALISLNQWLPQLASQVPARHKEIVQLINKLTPPTVKFAGTFTDGDFQFGYRGLNLPFSALSDGYRAHIGWIGDLLYHLQSIAPPGSKLTSMTGVVLVDEIDAHIHPDWQRSVIPDLARTFPALQFIITTHSPLVTGTLERANLIHVTRGTSGSPEVERPDEETYGLSADQILRTELFGLDSTRDPEFRAGLVESARDASSGKPDATLAFMRKAAIGMAGMMADEPEKRETPEWLKKLAAKK